MGKKTKIRRKKRPRAKKEENRVKKITKRGPTKKGKKNLQKCLNLRHSRNKRKSNRIKNYDLLKFGYN